MSKPVETLPERRLINRKRVELITMLKGGSLSRAMDRGDIPEPLMFGDNTPRWWEHEIYEALDRIRRGRGRFYGKRNTGKRAKQQHQDHASSNPPA
jgi:hypothetical protein